MKYLLAALPFLAALAVPASPIAQAKPTDIYVSVVDKDGEPATGLTAADFHVKEDGIAREVLKAGPATEPLTVAFLVDDSQAIAPQIQMVREGAENFVTALAGKAEISLQTFGERPTIAVEYTTDQKKLLDGVHHLFARQGSGTYLMEAIVEACHGIEKRKPARPVIAVLMVDRDVEFSNNYYQNVLDEIQKAGAALHVVSLGPVHQTMGDEIRNRDQVVAIGTDRTGGRRDNILAFTAAGAKMKQLAAELLDQYLVTYARPDRLIPPEKIDVTVSKPGLTARARTRTAEAGAR
ncbi:MAG TPA: VWA domain-containing protein [Vicinamibacterales bacterium]|nr:VWA domain-containing protein [Vicinamibacterales bacterium]